jgi:hypothetical protein
MERTRFFAPSLSVIPHRRGAVGCGRHTRSTPGVRPPTLSLPSSAKVVGPAVPPLASTLRACYRDSRPPRGADLPQAAAARRCAWTHRPPCRCLGGRGSRRRRCRQFTPRAPLRLYPVSGSNSTPGVTSMLRYLWLARRQRGLSARLAPGTFATRRVHCSQSQKLRSPTQSNGSLIRRVELIAKPAGSLRRLGHFLIPALVLDLGPGFRFGARSVTDSMHSISAVVEESSGGDRGDGGAGQRGDRVDSVHRRGV